MRGAPRRVRSSRRSGTTTGRPCTGGACPCESWVALRAQETKRACEQALEHLDAAGASGRRLATTVRSRLIAAYVYRAATRRRGDRSGNRALGAGRFGLLAQAWARGVIGRLCAMKGDFDRGRELHARGAPDLSRCGDDPDSAAGIAMGEAHGSSGSPAIDAAAESVLREGIASLESIGDRAFYPTAALQLATILYAQERYEEVREWCAKARATTGARRSRQLPRARLLEGLLLAREGSMSEAEEAAARAISAARADRDERDFEVYGATVHLAELFALAWAGPRSPASTGRRRCALLDAKGDVASARETSRAAGCRWAS